MGFPKRRGVFDPLDLEIIERVYETAWAQLEAQEPLPLALLVEKSLPV